ncbi:MAG: 16S rRNA (uracil(1498)-N(3))-methyltransferase [Defluviitaleaceae bacterium]|nr:16S rRNA (uracil(1498)-N(3))-methyltransferase [Defluviitaleaceae bacterium]
MHRFFINPDEMKDQTVVLTGENAYHGNVLRLRAGEEIVVAMGDGFDHRCAVTQVDKREIHANVTAKLENETELPVKITLFQALPKGDKMADIIEFAVELGVHSIVPVETARCLAKGDKAERWQKIAEAGAKLSHRAYIPQIGQICSLEEAIAQAQALDMPFACFEGEKTYNLPGLLQGKSPATIGFFVGPEGGFDYDEVDLFHKSIIPTITLGKRILRTQSAAACVLAGINFWQSMAK